MVPRTLMPTLLALGLIAIGAGPAHTQLGQMLAQGAAAFPCPSGDASCGNGAPAGTTNSGKHKHHKHRNDATQNSLPDSNPNQKIEGAGPGDVDEGVNQDLQEMNRQGGAHEVNQPK
jgi:hypothetical protein